MPGLAFLELVCVVDVVLHGAPVCYLAENITFGKPNQLNTTRSRKTDFPSITQNPLYKQTDTIASYVQRHTFPTRPVITPGTVCLPRSHNADKWLTRKNKLCEQTERNNRTKGLRTLPKAHLSHSTSAACNHTQK